MEHNYECIFVNYWVIIAFDEVHLRRSLAHTDGLVDSMERA